MPCLGGRFSGLPRREAARPPSEADKASLRREAHESWRADASRDGVAALEGLAVGELYEALSSATTPVAKIREIDARAAYGSIGKRNWTPKALPLTATMLFGCTLAARAFFAAFLVLLARQSALCGETRLPARLALLLLRPRGAEAQGPKGPDKQVRPSSTGAQQMCLTIWPPSS
jgi:hypothetical protein